MESCIDVNACVVGDWICTAIKRLPCFSFSHGKIQSVRIHSGETTCNAIVAFVDTKSATRAVESTVRLNKTKLLLQYCESSGVPASNPQESVIITDATSIASSR